MTPTRTNRLAPLLAVAGCLFGLLLAAYVGGYFVLGQHKGIEVTFDAAGLFSVYYPAAVIESRVRGRPILLTYRASSSHVTTELVD